MSDDFYIDPDAVENAAEHAPESGFAPVNYGRLKAKAEILWFTEAEDPTTGQKVRTPNRRPAKKGETPKDRETMEITFNVDVQELNPALTFEYERRVAMRKTGRNKTDWSEIVLPSLIATFGKDWAKAISAKPYVEVEDVPNVAGKASSSGKMYGVPKFLHAYKSKAECMAAREARFAGSGSNSTPAAASGGIPENIVAQAKGLIASVGKDKALGMLQGKPLGDYDPDVLFALATAE